MDFLRSVRDIVHGWSEETRKFLAMSAMGVALVAFFALWVSSVSSHLAVISLPPVTQVAQNNTGSSPTAFLPQDSGLEDGSILGQDGQTQPQDQAAILGQTEAQNQPFVPQPSVSGRVPASLPPAEQVQPTEQALTPVQGVAETFSGLNKLFATANTQSSTETWVRQQLHNLGDLARRVAADLLRMGRNAMQAFFVWLQGLAPHQYPALNIP